MIYHGDCTIDCGEHGHHHVELLRMIPAGSKLYTAPQPSPTPQADSVTAPAAGAVAHTISDAQIEAMPVWRNFVGLWPESRREIVDAVVDLLAAAPAQQVQEDAGGANWQDISTAPKDGTRFVAVGNNYGLYSETQHVCIAQWFRGCWIEASDWNETSELKYLTHWMPLLPLPGNAARKQGANHD